MAIVIGGDYRNSGADVYIYDAVSEEKPSAVCTLGHWFPPAKEVYERAFNAGKIKLGRTAIAPVGQSEILIDDKTQKVGGVYVAYLPIRRKTLHRAQKLDMEKCIFSLSHRLRDKNFYIAFPCDHRELGQEHIIKYAIDLFKNHSCTLVLCNLPNIKEVV